METLKYTSIAELVNVATERGELISQIVLRDQAEQMDVEPKVLFQKMRSNYQVMRESIQKGTDPDTLIAFYRNTTDIDGNPVEQYSYAFSVTETDYEHGNGMTYNPNTQEIAIAGLFTNDPSDAGAIFIVDANTLHFKRKVQVGNGSINFFGIDYVPEKDQYVLMANRIADYAFYFTDSNFQIVDKLNLHLSYSRSSFQKAPQTRIRESQRFLWCEQQENPYRI